MRKSIHSQPYRVLLDQLIAARKASGLTQQELADRLKRPQSFIAKVEGGDRRLDVIELIQITEILGADATKIIRQVRDSMSLTRR